MKSRMVSVLPLRSCAGVQINVGGIDDLFVGQRKHTAAADDQIARDGVDAGSLFISSLPLMIVTPL